ncbi:MAG: hypothetical protein ACFCGT_14635, partial [Sandaracinaceae bacterium]
GAPPDSPRAAGRDAADEAGAPPDSPRAAGRDAADVHAPVDSSLVSLPADDPPWTALADPEAPTAPGTVDAAPDSGTFAEPAVAGRSSLPSPASFAPGLGTAEGDRWSDEDTPVETFAQARQRAEDLFQRGEVSAALELYQELAVARPGDAGLWTRIREVAGALQRQTSPPDDGSEGTGGPPRA